MTVVAVVGVTAGPAMFECSASPAGFAACMRDKASGLGLLPPAEQPAEAVVQAEAPADAAAAPTDVAAAPRLTLVNAAPDGSMVIVTTRR